MSTLASNVSNRMLKEKSLLSLIILGLGFFGIQYAWAVQYSQMSTFLEKLGSVAWLTALIWCAGPVTGTFTQPILAAFSDKTWTWLGSRRPFLLGGALVCAACMFAMPNAPNLLTAALILWIWDTSINVCQGPIRWLAVDVVPQKQQALTFSIMGFILAIGASVCFILGSFITNIHFLFYFGAIALLITMAFTIFGTPEEKLPHIDKLTTEEKKVDLTKIAKETWEALTKMHPEAKKLCWANGLTWFGAQCMFVFFPLYIVHNIFGATDPDSALYIAGRQHVSSAWLAYYVVCFVASLFVGKLSSRYSMKSIHTVGLSCMALSLFFMYFAATPIQALIAMGVCGIGWATTMAIPFAWAARYIPEGKGGMHLGVFNIYICWGSVIASPIAGSVVTWTGNDASALIVAGSVVLLSVLMLQSVKETDEDFADGNLATA